MPIFVGEGQLSLGVTNHVALNGRPRPLRRSFELFRKRKMDSLFKKDLKMKVFEIEMIG